MKKIYSTNEWSGYEKQNYYHNEYRKKGNKVFKYKCHRFKFFNGRENTWETDAIKEIHIELQNDRLAITN